MPNLVPGRACRVYFCLGLQAIVVLGLMHWETTARSKTRLPAARAGTEKEARAHQVRSIFDAQSRHHGFQQLGQAEKTVEQRDAKEFFADLRATFAYSAVMHAEREHIVTLATSTCLGSLLVKTNPKFSRKERSPNRTLPFHFL